MEQKKNLLYNMSLSPQIFKNPLLNLRIGKFKKNKTVANLGDP